MKRTGPLPSGRSVRGLRKWRYSHVQGVPVFLHKITVWISIDMELFLQMAWGGQRAHAGSLQLRKIESVRYRVGLGGHW